MESVFCAFFCELNESLIRWLDRLWWIYAAILISVRRTNFFPIQIHRKLIRRGWFQWLIALFTGELCNLLWHFADIMCYKACITEQIFGWKLSKQMQMSLKLQLHVFCRKITNHLTVNLFEVHDGKSSKISRLLTFDFANWSLLNSSKCCRRVLRRLR